MMDLPKKTLPAQAQTPTKANSSSSRCDCDCEYVCSWRVYMCSCACLRARCPKPIALSRGGIPAKSSLYAGAATRQCSAVHQSSPSVQSPSEQSFSAVSIRAVLQCSLHQSSPLEQSFSAVHQSSPSVQCRVAAAALKWCQPSPLNSAAAEQNSAQVKA